jgi:glucoamylase
VTKAPPAAVPVSITAPAAGASVDGTTTVTGTTTPGASIVVSVADTDAPAAVVPVTTTAGSGGAFAVAVPVGFGTNVITVAATTSTGTGTAQVSVVGDLVGGTSVLDVTDPTGDDSGPGTYQYPTAADFVPGSFDITRFQVLTQGSTVYLRTTLKTLTPTFGNILGAQLLDVYVHTPSASPTSTAAAFPSRNYTIAPASAWSQRIEVQGFASPVWVDAGGNPVGTLPAAQFGTPTSGWSFALALTGQDGFSADQARAFTANPGAFSFGVCAAGGSAPICSVDPNTVPKVMDTITPAGVTQSSELDPTLGPVVLAGVPVP